jgi:autotransporter-associated beta strand protein
VLNGGAIQASGGPRTIGNAVRIDGNGTLGGTEDMIFSGIWTLNTTGTLTVDNYTTISGSIGEFGSQGFVKDGSGTLVLDGINGYSGNTTVKQGTLAVTGRSEQSGFIIQNGATLTGGGTVGPLRVESGGRLAPGGSPGTLNAGATTWEPNGIYDWEINQADGVAGSNPGWDLLNIDGTLTITATSDAKFMIVLNTLAPPTPPDTAGAMANFDSARSYTWTIAAASGGIADFSPDKFSIVAAAFANGLAGGSLTLVQDGNSINLVFTPVEPRLTLVRSSDQVVVSWPAALSGFVLQTCIDLSQPMWSDVLDTPIANGDHWQSTHNTDSGQRFYRLLRP